MLQNIKSRSKTELLKMYLNWDEAYKHLVHERALDPGDEAPVVEVVGSCLG